MTWKRIGRLVLLASTFGAALAIHPAPAHAVSISPRLRQAAKTPAEAAALRERESRYQAMKSRGVDKIFPQFALDMSKYPRGGVAHRNLLVVLAQFPAEGINPAWMPSSKSTPFYYNRLFFSNDPNDGIISVREYYENQSHGRLILSGSVTSKWITMPHSYAYYANGSSGLDFFAYPRSAQRLAEDAMGAAYTDFNGKLGSFDNDGPDGVASSGDDDGYMDAVLVIHPGRGAEIIPPPQTQGDENPDWALWSHEAGITQFTGCNGLNSTDNCVPGYQLGSVKGFLYVLLGEFSDFPGDFSVGTYCHEFGHTLGLPDLYDPSAGGLGFYSLMSLGNYLPYAQNQVLGSRPGSLDAWSRQYLGFDTPDVVKTPGPYQLPAVTQGGGSLRIWTNGEPGTEYFLVEHRRTVGSDEFLPGDGLLVYHVDDTKESNLGGAGNYRVSIVQADGRQDLESPSGNFGDPGDPFPGSTGNRNLNNSTTPNTRSFAGAATGVSISNIVAGSTDNVDIATFDVAISTRPEIRITRVTTDDGGGDGLPDPGESVDVSIQLKNVGLASGALTLTLSTADAAATVTTSASSAPALAGGATGSAQTPFTVSIDNAAPLLHDVLMNLHWTDGSASGDQTFLITVGMGSGLAENFELGTTGWSHVAVDPSVSTSDEWHLTAVRAHGGAGSMKIGSSNALGSGTNEAQTYASDQDAALISPAFDLPANSELVFWSYVDAETNGGTGAWDGGRVEISLAGGGWMPLGIDNGYDHMMEFNSSAGLRGAEVLSGSPRSWRRVVADLSPYSGPVRVRFRFATDTANDPRDQNGAQLRYYEGWYVDDIAVQARSSSGPIPRHITFRAGPTPYRLNGPSSGSVQFRFSAPDGLPKAGETPEIKIYDVRGREVGHTFATANPLAPAEFRATWNPRSEGNADLGSGIYFARVDFMGKAQTVRLVLVR